MWRSIPGFSNYEANEEGQIVSLRVGAPPRFLKPIVDRRYWYVTLYQNGKACKRGWHVAVLSAFEPKPDPSLQCCHNDGNPQNNTLSNLRWGTVKENCADKKLHGTDPLGEKNGAYTAPYRRRAGSDNGAHKLTEFEVIEIKTALAEGIRGSVLADKYSVSRSLISAIKQGHNWKRLEESVILSDKEIRHRLENRGLSIQPIQDLEAQLQPASFDIRLADVGAPAEAVEAGWILRPGSFALASTIERVKIPDDIVAQVNGKSSLGRLGLFIHITAGFLDPGFVGDIVLELYNCTQEPVVLTKNMYIAQLVFTRLLSSCERPYGHPSRKSKYQGQRGITKSRVRAPGFDDWDKEDWR